MQKNITRKRERKKGEREKKEREFKEKEIYFFKKSKNIHANKIAKEL